MIEKISKQYWRKINWYNQTHNIRHNTISLKQIVFPHVRFEGLRSCMPIHSWMHYLNILKYIKCLTFPHYVLSGYNFFQFIAAMGVYIYWSRALEHHVEVVKCCNWNAISSSLTCFAQIQENRENFSLDIKRRNNIK